MVPVLKTVSDHLHLMQAELCSCSINNPCGLYSKIGVFCETQAFSSVRKCTFNVSMGSIPGRGHARDTAQVLGLLSDLLGTADLLPSGRSGKLPSSLRPF